jgi:[ribosomal protein S18]-alanine N-acetyltransferase
MWEIGRFTFRQIDIAAARRIAAWEYPPPYDLYSYNPAEAEENVQGLLTPDYHYYTVWDERGELIGYRCFGEDAQVFGGDYSAEALDMGGGLRPDLTGQGSGAAFMTAAITFAQQQFAPAAFRATVAAFNQRALRVCIKVGYRPIQQFENPHTGRPFVVLLHDNNQTQTVLKHFS